MVTATTTVTTTETTETMKTTTTTTTTTTRTVDDLDVLWLSMRIVDNPFPANGGLAGRGFRWAGSPATCAGPTCCVPSSGPTNPRTTSHGRCSSTAACTGTLRSAMKCWAADEPEELLRLGILALPSAHGPGAHAGTAHSEGGAPQSAALPQPGRRSEPAARHAEPLGVWASSVPRSLQKAPSARGDRNPWSACDRGDAIDQPSANDRRHVSKERVKIA